MYARAHTHTYICRQQWVPWTVTVWCNADRCSRCHGDVVYTNRTKTIDQRTGRTQSLLFACNRRRSSSSRKFLPWPGIQYLYSMSSSARIAIAVDTVSVWRVMLFGLQKQYTVHLLTSVKCKWYLCNLSVSSFGHVLCDAIDVCILYPPTVRRIYAFVWTVHPPFRHCFLRTEFAHCSRR